MRREAFGIAADGGTVERVVISGGGLTAAVITRGAAVQDLRLDGHPHPLVLGFSRYEDYAAHSPYFGETVGRCANRIAGGHFTIDGVTYQAERNERGRNTLHGGSRGIGTRNWRIADLGPGRVRLELTDPDGAMGFPGNCELAVTYRLPGDGRLAIAMEGRTDAPTLVNLAHHSYFNLDGSADIRDHQMMIAADTYLPVDAELIPTGEVRAVDGTPFDLRLPRRLRDGPAGGYDHNYCLSSARMPIREVARLFSPASGLAMTISTTEAGLQFYTGQGVATPVAGLAGRPYGKWSGLCLEPQAWPDSPNHPGFPGAVMRPGETYLQETEYRFTQA